MKTRMRLAMPVPTASNRTPSYETLATRRHSDPVPPRAEDGDELRPARGVLFAALLGVCLWLGILYTWLIVR